ncbi:MAG: 30S ribosomal protein S20 [Deltaproteobacteria bacterium]|nr:30S ribosomal protein S20 [Deltaproteobacteria bacterium]
MANHKSAEKRMRQSERKRQRNVSAKSHVKTRVKAVLQAVEENNATLSKETLSTAVRVISKASSRGIIHKNNAARKISRLTRKVNSLTSGE